MQRTAYQSVTLACGAYAEGRIHPRDSVLAQITNGLTFDPEEVLAYQVGHKSQFADNTVQMNAELFYYDSTDLQVNQLINNTNY